jgi:signal transduction histidine kinase
MGIPQGTGAESALIPDSGRPAGSAAAVLDFAVAQILRDDTTLGALPTVLERLVDVFGLRAALAFQPSAGQPSDGRASDARASDGRASDGRASDGRASDGRASDGRASDGRAAVALLAAHPGQAAEPALLARLDALVLEQAGAASGASWFPVRLAVEGTEAASALLACSVPVAGQCLCALALIGDGASWDEEVGATAHAVAAIVATQIRHTNDVGGLADQTERLNCLIANAIPGVLFTDEEGLITHVSQSFGAMFGIADPERLVGTSDDSIVERIRGVFTDPGEFAREVEEVSRARQPMSGKEIQCADGRTIEGDYWPVIVDGRYRGGLWLAWDMSTRKALDQRRNQFLAIVSHELRTPLTSIVSFIELIRGEAEGLTPEGLSFLDVIERNADRLHRLVGDLLMLDRLEAGALPLDLEPVDVADLVTEAVASAAPSAKKQGVTLEVRADAGPPVRGDFRRLMQVLDNLIANAVKFSHLDGLVSVTATYRRRTWRIDVADSGIGIPEEEAGQLFSRFVRASNARTAGLPGTGLGLSIVKVLVEMHGGHVEVRSALGQGSTFSVYLPAPASRGRA